MADTISLTKPETGDVDIMDLNPAFGCFCCIASCFTVWPDCLGCSGSQVCCCISNEIVGFKRSKDPDAYCLCLQDKIEIIPVRVCVKARTQCFCLDVRAAMPCDKDIPCMMTFLFLTCAYKFKCSCACCSKVGLIENKHNKA